MPQPLPRIALAMIPVGIALNVTVGTLANVTKVPVYLDAIGTIAVAITTGWLPAAIAGVLSFLIGGMIVNPVLPWFSGSQVAIAVCVAIFASRGWLKSWRRVIACGVALGIVAAVVGAPVIVYLFGGITGSGRSLITAALIAGGQSVLDAVILSGAASEPIDKTIQLILGVLLVRNLPSSILWRLFGDRRMPPLPAPGG